MDSCHEGRHEDALKGNGDAMDGIFVLIKDNLFSAYRLKSWRTKADDGSLGLDSDGNGR